MEQVRVDVSQVKWWLLERVKYGKEIKMLSTLTVDRKNLPEAFREWLESGGQAKGILLFREENGQIILEKLDDVDLSMIERVRANMIKYRSALQRLAE